MKVAVLPVTVSDKARFTTLTRAWIERACESVHRYFTDQSGGRAQLEFKVFDWYALSMTHDDWLKLGSNVSEVVNAEIAEGLQISFEGFDRFVYIQDFNTSIYGVTNGDETRIEARDFDPTLLAHEFGHVFGAGDAFLDTSSGPMVYGDLFCVMGGENERGQDNGKHSFPVPDLISPSDGADITYAHAGPGMCVPSLLATGWLDLKAHAAKVSEFAAGLGSTLQMRALDGAPVGNGSGLPVCSFIDAGYRYYFEYRIRASRWDAGMPASPHGWLVIHRGEIDEPSITLLIGAHAVTPGQTITIGGPSNIYLFGGGPLRLTVLNCDANAGLIGLHVYRRKGKPPQYIEPFEGFRAQFGAVLWTPDAGWRTFPVESEFADVLDKVAQLEHTTLVARSAERQHLPVFAATSLRKVTELQESVGRIPTAKLDTSIASPNVATMPLRSVGTRA